MKIGIITFHWATNYGAILQAYALQNYLLELGHDVEIINYLPRRNIFLQRLTWIRNRQWGNFKKENKLHLFRKNNLFISSKTYKSNRALYSMKKKYDIIISGSDQVWNLSFIQYAEQSKQTYSYYLDFVSRDTKKVSYAASFGTNMIPFEYKANIREELSTFSAISVRELTAKAILEELGLAAKVVIDPTLLIEREYYERFCCSQKDNERLLVYKLHNNQSLFDKIERYLSEGTKTHKVHSEMSMSDWLGSIKNAKLVLTNSFHGMVFSILFEVPFISVLVEGSDMNDRIITLLSSLGLEDRYIHTYDEKLIEEIRISSIDWNKVAQKLEVLKGEAKEFLLSAIYENGAKCER